MSNLPPRVSRQALQPGTLSANPTPPPHPRTQEYALRIPLWMAHKTPEILHAFNATGRAATMGRALDCVWRLHWWRRPHGRAFEMTMCELKRRLVGGKGAGGGGGGGGAKIELDVVGCRIRCGEGQRWWKINGPDNETVVV